MTYETFLKITLNLQKQDRIVQELYKYKVDLLDFADPYHEIISTLIKEIYGEYGLDWFSWFCYENEYGTRGLEAFDENKNRICYSHESLWEFLEKHKNEKGSAFNENNTKYYNHKALWEFLEKNYKNEKGSTL